MVSVVFVLFLSFVVFVFGVFVVVIVAVVFVVVVIMAGMMVPYSQYCYSIRYLKYIHLKITLVVTWASVFH